jgi:hypothetical protein
MVDFMLIFAIKQHFTVKNELFDQKIAIKALKNH